MATAVYLWDGGDILVWTWNNASYSARQLEGIIV